MQAREERLDEHVLQGPRFEAAHLDTS